MAVFQCKMCGGSLEFSNETVATCEYCGTQQTLPRLDSDKKRVLYDRANHFRRLNDFDKAAELYEQVLREDNADSEAYWSLVLCRYGIEYVEDAATHKRHPTVNRAQFTSILNDADYLSALQYADSYQRSVYEREANQIHDIQKGILAISQKEEPFDIFICYKEKDEFGSRTHDSVLANDLYHLLTNQGYKVFFARITLEDKLGVAYEPYIFAALNSAKVMVVLGTKKEYFQAVWVKNEWSRFLAMTKQDPSKILIPAYRDMDAYDLPEEFSFLQAQDMSKLGFMQDLLHGIGKLVPNRKAPTYNEPAPTPSGGAVTPLLKRAFIFLEDGDFANADEYCEKVLDQDPENAQAYLGKMMIDLRCKTRKDLSRLNVPFTKSPNYQKVLRYADDALRDEISGYNSRISDRLAEAHKEDIYSRAATALQSTVNPQTLLQHANELDSISDYRDASELARKCRDRAIALPKENIYNLALGILSNPNTSTDKLLEIAGKLDTIPEWKDSTDLAAQCREKAKLMDLQKVYNQANQTLMASSSKDEASLESAARAFASLGNWKDAPQKASQCRSIIMQRRERNARYETYLRTYPEARNKDAYTTRLQNVRSEIQSVKNSMPGMAGYLIRTAATVFLCFMGPVGIIIALVALKPFKHAKLMTEGQKRLRPLKKEEKQLEKKLEKIGNIPPFQG